MTNQPRAGLVALGVIIIACIVALVVIWLCFRIGG